MGHQGYVGVSLRHPGAWPVAIHRAARASSLPNRPLRTLARRIPLPTHRTRPTRRAPRDPRGMSHLGRSAERDGISGVPAPYVQMTVEREEGQRRGQKAVELVPALLRNPARSGVVHLMQEFQTLRPAGPERFRAHYRCVRTRRASTDQSSTRARLSGAGQLLITASSWKYRSLRVRTQR